MATQAQKDVHQEIDSLKAEIQQTKQELASPQHANEAAQLDFLRKHLLHLNSQLASMREQQTILLRSTQQPPPCHHLSDTEPPLKKWQVDQPPELQAAADPLDQVVGSLQSQGFAWLKISGPETYTFHRLKQFAHEQQGSCFDQAGEELRDKQLVEHCVGEPHPKLSQAVRRAADEVCNLMDRHTRRILDAISSSRHIGLPASALNSILDATGSSQGARASSYLQINQYFLREDDWGGTPHIDRGVLTLIWSDRISGYCPVTASLKPVDIPKGYMLVLTGHTLEHATCGIFKAAPHSVTGKWSEKRLSFAYKLRSPGDAVLNQYASLAASGKQLNNKYKTEITVSALMGKFWQSRTSVNHLGADMVHMGLSPEWQHAITEWRASRHTVNNDWIWHKLISTMDGWKPPDQTMIFKKSWDASAFSLCVHPTWKLVGIESLLEVVHGMPPPGSLRVIHGGRQIRFNQRLSETAVQNESTVHLLTTLRGD
ncbi:hypothetical protein ABBQ38_015175 [Trebouxia sp. C0009 RCD-2024]